MTEVRQFKLPGVGTRYEFNTRSGRRVCVVSHRSGRREVMIADPRDPDAFHEVLDLDEQDSVTLAELLGGHHITEQLAGLEPGVEGLSVDWLPVREDSPYAGQTIGDARIRTRTGVSVVALLRGSEAIAAPGPESPIEAGDFLVVVGTNRGIEEVVELLRRG
jgi:TrkA domain protein